MFCKVCGSDDVTIEKKSLKLNRLGLKNIVIRNIEHISCEDCGHTAQSLPKYNLMMKQVRISLASSNRPLSGKEFAFLREKLGLSGLQAAKELGVSNVSISRWEKEHNDLSPMADRLIRALTLEELNSVKLQNVLSRISKNEPQEIYIDADDFKDVATFKHTSGYRFGRSKKPAWVVTKVS
ncbi:putative zinc finger/helix-turn-helix protein, YgiT family [Marinobacter persicus]|uniref:Putative zinc finger/helix-turn-helix protein, YgiT family n=1 Tax=Marinobacter persicus TaxID=930118 RepID=A0A1I3R2H1_9GAMM|nr:type II TA system antitoxin MqsA family protein [Marinobacter persicus]GHD43468.1 hypothetical protein GCM10008110_07450 [Marinobacter persicus]SFJ40783.1 putative zinc finger/helix-turn-helix protein, YgiT family [Marinobacter persicus]